MESFREAAADRYRIATGSPWTPRAGSRVNHRHLTAALIDSRDFLAARRRADNEVLVPAGPKIAFSGGDTADHRQIWAKLDQIHAKHPDMVLLHGGSPKGAEKIASLWADSRKVPQVAFKPDWTKHAKAAPFKRNDQMLNVVPIGVVIFPGTAFRTIWPTRPARWAFRSIASAPAAHKRRHNPHLECDGKSSILLSALSAY